MYSFWIVIVFLLFSIVGYTQKKLAPLPPELVESSALIKYKCSFLTLNDSGSEAKVFVFNKKGKIKHTCFIENATNVDWEAMAYDGETFLYIGDIGNNLNKRRDLAIYKVKMEDVLKKDTAKAEKISFTYPDQRQFPPKESGLYYDAEALIFKDDQLMIFTKNRTVPFDGISKVYALPIQPGNYTARSQNELSLLPTNWREESVTDATYFEGELYILTYSKVCMFTWENEMWVQKKQYEHNSWTQKEGIAVDKRFIYLTDENETGVFSNNYLYKLKK